MNGFWRWLADFLNSPVISVPSESQAVKDFAAKSQYADFTVEHYPETGRFYPTYKGSYIRRNDQTGIYELKPEFLFMYADYTSNEPGAWAIIDLFREQQLKETVRVITR